MTTEPVDPKDWWDEIDLGFGEVILMGLGPATPGVGGPNNVTSICYFDGRLLTTATGLFGHGRMLPEGAPDESYAETPRLPLAQGLLPPPLHDPGGER